MVKVVNVLRGPVHSSMIPDWDVDDDGFGLPYGEGYVLDVIVQDERGVVETDQLVFEDFDDAMEIVDHIFGQIVPYTWVDTF